MAKLASGVAKLMKRVGQPCEVRFKAVGSGSSAIPSEAHSTFIRIGQRTSAVMAGQLTSGVKALMAPIGRSLQDATVVVAGRAYVVVSADEQIYQGESAIVRLVLK